jgi:1,2-diacylglycerol 3-beta-glucosyltransferase
MVLHIVAMAGVVLASGALLASLYILIFSIAGSALGPTLRVADSPAEPFFLILIPAHNEANGIQATIESVQRLNYPRDRFRVVTIADNCDDLTADVAARCGAEVWVRNDLQNRGKGQALSWAFDRAFHDAFDLAVVIDADTEVDANFLRAMASDAGAAGAALERSAFQGRYEFAPTSEKGGWFETFTIASKAAENSFVYRPRSAAGLVNLIQGNGFCVPRAVLEGVRFAASSVVEDAEYAITLALAGVRVRYVDAARVDSRMTRNIQDAAPQRLRWASGILQLICRSVPKLVTAGVTKRNWKLLEAALMLVLTSRLVVLYITLAALMVAAIELPAHGAGLILELLLSTVIVQATYLWMIFRRSALKPFPIVDLLFMPAYLGIIGVTQVAAMLGLRRKRWARTVR